MRIYRAIFIYAEDGINVSFPDLDGCLTSGDTRDEAYEMAMDVLPMWLAHAKSQFINEPSSHAGLKKKYPDDEIVEIPVDEKIYESYLPTKRFNASFKQKLLNELDDYVIHSDFTDRSKLLSTAVQEYMSSHPNK